MKIAMLYPSRESEKAISGYSLTLVENIKKTGIDISSLNYEAGNPFSIFKKINQFKKYDGIHIQHEYNLLGWYGLPFFILYFLLFLSGVKIITTFHTVVPLNEKFNENRLRTLFRKILYITQNRWISLFSKKIIVHTDFIKKNLVEEYNVPEKKIVVLPQGIIEEVPLYNKSKIKRELKLKGNVYLIMGSMVPDHGHDIVVKQSDKIGKTILIVANPGSVNDRNSKRTREYLEQTKKISKENNLSKFVRFDIDEKITDKNPIWWKYFSAADLVLLPYRVGHGSGIFAHSMAARIPVIGSNVKFFNEIAGKYGCVKVAKNEEDYANVIKEAMNVKNHKKMVQECERYLKENGLSVLSSKYRKVYLDLKK